MSSAETTERLYGPNKPLERGIILGENGGFTIEPDPSQA